MMKVIKTAILATILMMSCSLSARTPLTWSKFEWKGDTISGQYLDKAFIYVPVKIDDMPFSFTMQLDLGSSETQFYGTTIKPYVEQDTCLANKASAWGLVKDAFFKAVCLHMGDKNDTIDVWLRHDFGDKILRDSIYTATPKHIGTIGSDMFANRVLIIDYPSQKFAITDTIPTSYINTPAVPFELYEGIIKLPFQINGKICNVMFDTGSSPFELVTTKEQALQIADPIVTDSLSGPLWWGQQITFYGLKANKPIIFGGKSPTQSKVYYDKEGLWREVFESLNVWGITGNAYFYDQIVVIDYKNKLFRIK